jgi:S1-C subfamily serine protease
MKAPVDIGWRIRVARQALSFFHHNSDLHAEALEVLEKTDPAGTMNPFSVADFLTYLSKVSADGSYWPRKAHVDRVLAKLEAVGLLTRRGIGGDLNRQFVAETGIPRSQATGYLWLSEALGRGVLVPAYGSVSIPILGTKATGDDGIGTGLLVGPNHIITAGHVVEGLSDIRIALPRVLPPIELEDTTITTSAVLDAVAHPDIDVGIITLSEPMTSLAGIAFRDPVWTDQTTVFGFPPIPFSLDAHLVVQTGEVVNPAIATYDGRQVFLFSATARPGNSGGAIVGADGRVLGIVTDQLGEEETATETANGVTPRGTYPGTPFYAGVPATLMHRAASDMGFQDLLIEDWS